MNSREIRADSQPCRSRWTRSSASRWCAAGICLYGADAVELVNIITSGLSGYVSRAGGAIGATATIHQFSTAASRGTLYS